MLPQVSPALFNPQYAAKVLSVERANLIGYWPMWERSGAISRDYSPRGNHGVYTGATLGQPGIGDGRTSIFCDGVNDFSNIISAGLGADFDGDEGTFLIWMKVANAGVWTDGIARRPLTIEVDGNNYMLFDKPAANSIRGIYRAGGTLETGTRGGITTLDFFSFAMNWSAIADEVKYYYNGAWFETDTALGAWVGPIIRAIIGAATVTPAFPWHGWLAHAMLFSTPLSDVNVGHLGVL